MNSPLYHACRNGDTERVRQLLDKGAPADEKDEDGWTALMCASLKGHIRPQTPGESDWGAEWLVRP